jgi:ATP-dependent exoDNAse (exonuclease V) alpha subunit
MVLSARRGSAAVVEAAIGSADGLSIEQADLVRRWLTSGDRVQSDIGRAGTGTTTTMRVAARAWTDAGYRVLGASVKGEAARLLADDAGIESETVAMLLGRSDAGIRVLDSRTVLIVDEASTIGDRDLLRLCDLATETGAALRLIGDPAQHGSVPAGGSFNELVDLYADRTPQLAKVHRPTDAGERRRADLVRSGRVDEAVEELQASGQLVLTANEHDTHAAMLARWYTERTAVRPHPMVHGRNRERRVLNTLAQQLLIADGTVDASECAVLGDGRRLCVGDQVVARHGDRTVHPIDNRNGWMRNGTTGRVVGIRLDPAAPEFDQIHVATSDGIITCDRVTFDRADGGVDLAYAVTSYAVQGSTNDVSTSAITASTSRSELYVDITRGRHNNQLYGTRPVKNGTDTEQHLPHLGSELDSVLRARLARSTSRTALSRLRQRHRSHDYPAVGHLTGSSRPADEATTGQTWRRRSSTPKQRCGESLTTSRHHRSPRCCRIARHVRIWPPDGARPLPTSPCWRPNTRGQDTIRPVYEG